MKNKIIISLLLLTVLISSPLFVIDKSKLTKNNLNITETTNKKGFVSVMLSTNGKVETVSEREYVISSLAAEMDVNSSDEALKAQAIACRTYLQYTKLHSNKNSADISDNSEEGQGYCNENERKKSWGDKFEENEKRIETIVDSVIDLAITYNNEIIKPLYFDCSAGVTKDSEVVFNEKLPYLKSVNSTGDKLSVDYSDSTIISEDDFKNKFKSFTLSGSAEKWIGEIKRDKDGYVLSIKICDKPLSGSEFRKILNLKSCNFYISYKNRKFNVVTFGNGHQVGMSQTGAEYMAKQGADYNEILKHYYTGVEIKKWEQSD